MKKSIEEIGQLLNYEKLSVIHPLKLPKIEKEDIPGYINCPKYEKAKNNLNQKMERYQSKVDRCNDDIRQTEENITVMEQEWDRWHRKANPLFLNREDIDAVERQNHAADMANSLLDKISRAKEKYNDLIDKRAEAIEEADEKRQELTAEALLVIDEDIVAVLDRCTKIVDKLGSSQNLEDLVAAIDICLIELRIYAMFDDLIEENAVRKDCRERIAEVNKMFAALCANEQVLDYIVDMYRRNRELMQKNNEIYQQVVQVLGSVDQDQLTALTQSVNAVLAEEINTTFACRGIIDPAKLDEIIAQINKAIAALNQSIVKANELVTAAGDFAKTGVSADQQAKTLLSSMKSNVEAMKKDIISQDHFTVYMIDEAVIDDFYHKDVRSAIASLRKHLVETVGDETIDHLVKGGKDLFSLEKTETAIRQAGLLRLQDALEKIPAHIKKTTNLIASAESKINEVGQIPKQNADALKAELGKKYILACFPVYGWISAIGIFGRLKAFESAFRSTNQIYKDLANDLLEKNRKMTVVVMIMGAILGFGGIAVFFALNLGNSVIVNASVPGALLLLYVITVLFMLLVGKRIRSFSGISAKKQQNKSSKE